MSFSGNHNKNFICRRCLNSYTRENMLMIHKPKCENYNIVTIRPSSEYYLHWKGLFYKKSLYFRIFADFKADNEIDKCSIGNKTTNIYKQNPVPNRYHIISELGDLLKSGNYEFS